MKTETSPGGPVERIVGRAAQYPAGNCEHGCNGCDDCTDYDDSDEHRCPGCDGDGMDPMTDYALTCPVCGGMG